MITEHPGGVILQYQISPFVFPVPKSSLFVCALQGLSNRGLFIPFKNGSCNFFANQLWYRNQNFCVCQVSLHMHEFAVVCRYRKTKKKY